MVDHDVIDTDPDSDSDSDAGRLHAEVDVAVIGAGPTGSVAACAAARRGLSVALIDRSSFPRDKTCGDGIGPGAVRVLRELGLDSVLAGRRRIASVTVFGPGGGRSENPVPTIPGKSTDVFVVPRYEFDDHLFRAAIAAGARDLSGIRYVGMASPDPSSGPIPSPGSGSGFRAGSRPESGPAEDGARSRTVQLREASGARGTLRARLVIGADGAYSAVRKDLVGREQHRQQFLGIAMRAYAESPDFEAKDGAAGPSMLFEFSRDLLPSYGWIFPAGSGTINIGVGLPIAQLRERGVDLRRLLADFVERLRDRGVEIGELREERSHQLPAVIGMPGLAFDRAALIGDAASMINPVSGEGIAYGMTAATRLIRALPNDLADGAALNAALGGFERDFRADHRLHFLSCRLTMALLRHAVPATVVVRAIQEDPRVLSGVFDMLFGDGRLHAGTALRIARRALSAS